MHGVDHRVQKVCSPVRLEEAASEEVSEGLRRLLGVPTPIYTSRKRDVTGCCQLIHMSVHTWCDVCRKRLAEDAHHRSWHRKNSGGQRNVTAVLGEGEEEQHCAQDTQRLLLNTRRVQRARTISRPHRYTL